MEKLDVQKALTILADTSDKNLEAIANGEHREMFSQLAYFIKYDVEAETEDKLCLVHELVKNMEERAKYLRCANHVRTY